MYTTAPQQWVKSIIDKYGEQMGIVYRTNGSGKTTGEKKILMRKFLFFWVSPWRQCIIECRRFGTLYLFRLLRQW